MHNSITLAAASRLEAKLLETDVPLAVFAVHGSWQATKTNTAIYHEKLRRFPSRLVGVYTASVSLDDIADDFEISGIC